MADKAKTNKKLKSCMAALVALYNQARQELKDDNFSIEQVFNPLYRLFQAMSGIENDEVAQTKIHFNQCAYKDEMTDCVQVSMCGTVFELTRSDLEALVDAFDELNDHCLSDVITDDESILNFATREKIDRSIKHFKLIAEERNIRTEINEKLISTLSSSSLDDELRRRSREVISGSRGDNSMTSFRTTQHRFFVVEPLSSLGKKVLRAKFEQDRDMEGAMLIPDIWHDSYLNLGTVVASTCVHYHVVEGSFQRIKQCDTCKELFIAQRSDKLFCSKKCSKAGWAADDENEAYAKIKCRERQKQFFNYKEDLVLDWYQEDCKGCSYDPLPPGGQCSRWLDKHGEDEILRRIRKRSE